MTPDSILLILKNDQFKETVDDFKSYFSIQNFHPWIEYLEKILTSFSKLPYENISKIIKYKNNFDSANKIRLPFEIMEDHKSHNLGGTCFSLTFFLQTILKQQGFICYPVMADMNWGKNVHCTTIVDLNGQKYLIDPGYLLTRPMILSQGQSKIFKTEFSGIELRYQFEERKYDLFTFNQHQNKWRYKFEDKPVPDAEFFQHWLSSFEWNSMNGICLTKVKQEKLIYVHKTFMRETSYHGKKNFNIKNNYHQTLQDVFGIDKELVEEALVAVDFQKKRKQELGLWVPKKQKD